MGYACSDCDVQAGRRRRRRGGGGIRRISLAEKKPSARAPTPALQVRCFKYVGFGVQGMISMVINPKP